MSEAKARILLWGIESSGKSTTLSTIHEKLRADLRGEIKREPTRLDPTVFSESLLIQIGQADDLANEIELVAVPGAADQSMSRKQLLDGVDGIILVLDCSPEKIELNSATLQELQDSLCDYGRSLTDLPVVLQYNKRDVADPFAIEDLHRRIGLTQAAVFETIATTGHGILAALTTISKHVVRAQKETTPAKTPQAPVHAQTQAAEDPAPYELLEAAILAEGEGAQTAEFIDPLSEAFPSAATEPKPDSTSGGQLQIVSVGQARVTADSSVELPLVLGEEDGRTRSVRLTLRIDSLVGDGGD